MDIQKLRSYIGEKIQRLRYKSIYKLRNSVSILPWDESINEIKRNGKSLSRFGDGELLIVFQYLELATSTSTFQDFDKSLGLRLYQILHNESPSNCLIGLPHCMFGRGVSDMNFGARYFWERFSADWCQTVLNIIPQKQIYADTNLTRFYNDYKSKSRSKRQIDAIKTLWQDRDVVVIEGEQTRFGVGNDLLDNARSVSRILVPPTNAFSKYDSILNAAKANYKPGVLFLIAAGMTATVLAYDLAKLDMQALDIGHLDIEYEWLRMGATSRVKIEGKFTNESANRFSTVDCKDHKYLESIIDTIR